MSNWQTLIAALLGFVAFAALVQHNSEQVIVIGRPVAVDPTMASQGASAGVPKPGPLPSGIETRRRDMSSGPPSAKAADAEPGDGHQNGGTAPLAKRDAAGPSPVIEPVEPKPIEFAGAGLSDAAPALPSGLPAPDPWAPKVTRVDETPLPAANRDATVRPHPAGSELAAPPARPETALDDEFSIPDTHGSVAPFLARHPDRELILCLAGCGGGTSIVAIRPRSRVMATGEFLPASGQTVDDAGRPSAGDVICLAGCLGAPGSVVHRNVRLSWLGEDGSGRIKAALRAIADRILAEDGHDSGRGPRVSAWVSAVARDGLLPSASARAAVDEVAPQFSGAAMRDWLRGAPLALLAD